MIKNGGAMEIKIQEEVNKIKIEPFLGSIFSFVKSEFFMKKLSIEL